MNAIPAIVAGVKRLVMVVPTPDGEKNDLVLAAAKIAKVDRVFTIGGAQAIAALAYGTETIPRVDKIVGPGNAYVAEAKRKVFGTVGIDMIAGPSEITIICDGKTNPDWIAMDLFSQAEHDELSQSILIATDPKFLNLVMASIDKLIVEMTRKNVITSSLSNRGIFILAKDLKEAAAISDYIAPEHLELSVERSRIYYLMTSRMLERFLWVNTLLKLWVIIALDQIMFYQHQERQDSHHLWVFMTFKKDLV